jgi:hypothetical protein
MIFGPMRRYADKPDECGNVDKGFDPLHNHQSLAQVVRS